MAIKIGDTFRATYADANALWEVKAKQGRGMWRCEIVNERIKIGDRTYDGDYAGVVRGFTTEQIETSKAWDVSFENLMSEHDRFYAALPVGATVHYHNGFGQWLRCERVDGEERKRLVPTAMVGNWREYDLPRRNPDGTVNLGYQAKMIVNREAFEPNYSNIYEADPEKFRRDHRYGGVDPSTLPALDLTLPSMTADEVRVADLASWVNAIRDEVGEDPAERTAEAYEAIIERVRRLVTNEGDECGECAPMGECDGCDKRHCNASNTDHCPECGNCYEHCTCDIPESENRVLDGNR